jgi:hypothetical protein
MVPLAYRHAVEVFADITGADGISRKSGADIDSAYDDTVGSSS